MTTKEIRILGWTCLVFSWAFLAADAPWVTVVLGTIAGCLFIWEILRDQNNGGGPLSPA